jgi:hypothetical protein
MGPSYYPLGYPRPCGLAGYRCTVGLTGPKKKKNLSVRAKFVTQRALRANEPQSENLDDGQKRYSHSEVGRIR